MKGLGNIKLERRTYLLRLLWAFAVGVMGLALSLGNEGAISQELGSKTPEKHYNRLILEKSPYLLQHADDPVDWYPWGQEAFEKARRENKPIFLSIGYSTCHWCHVMERESFENPEVARLMNETFVSIKVDREERPDIDSIYMTIYEMTMGSGAWPLSIIMTPDKKPFYVRTYIPRGVFRVKIEKERKHKKVATNIWREKMAFEPRFELGSPLDRT